MSGFVEADRRAERYEGKTTTGASSFGVVENANGGLKGLSLGVLEDQGR